MVKEITIGDTVKDEVFLLESVTRIENGYMAVLSDKTGKIRAEISDERFEEAIHGFVEGAVKVCGVVLDGNDGEILLKIKSMLLAQKGEFKPTDLRDGICEDKIKEYTAIIKDAIARIPDKGCQCLCKNVLRDEHLALLASCPASLAYQAKYRGGALAQTAIVCRFVLQVGVSMQKYGNEFYVNGDNGIAWSVLLTGALLHMAAIPDYFEEQPWKRSAIGIDRGYMSLLQSRIEAANHKEDGVFVAPELLARILNVLQVAQPKSVVKASSLEGVLLRQQVHTFIETDMLSHAVLESSDAQFFDIRTRRYINTAQVEGQKEAVA